jgi:hypothetical protein
MSLWERMQGFVNRDRQELADEWITGARTDEAIPDIEMKAEEHYLRVSVAQMFLKDKKKLLTEYYPALSSLVRCDFGDAPQVELPNLADSSRMLPTQDGKGDVIVRNVPLVPLIPFRGGTVNIAAGLFAMAGTNQLKDFLSVMSGFASLLSVPQVSGALAIATPLATGIQKLVDGAGGMHLGYENTFVGAGGQGNILKAGYRAVVRVPAANLNKAALVVADRQLREREAAGSTATTAFERADFMLLHFELRSDRDDWNALSSIATPFRGAVTALEEGDDAKADVLFRQALGAALKAPELTKVDRRRVIDLLKKDYQQARSDLGFRGLVERGETDLQHRMNAAAISVKKALDLGEPTYDEIAGSLD